MDTPAERTERYLAEHEGDLLSLATDLIAIDSQIPPFGDERRIVAHLDALLARLGITDRRIVEPAPNRPSLIARLPGTGGGPTLMLCGHIDTKPVGAMGEQWLSDPFVATIRDGDLYGLGSTDMKGAVAAMLTAVRAIRASEVSLHGDVVLAFVADEEAGAVAGAREIGPMLAGERIDAAVIGEPSGWTRDWQGLHLVSRGIVGMIVTVEGTQKHSGLSDRLPTVNAATRAARLMIDAEERLSTGVFPDGCTVSVGVTLSGGVGFGVTPGRASFGLEIRTVPGMTPESVAAAVDEWLTAARGDDTDLSVSLTFAPGLEWLPWSAVSADDPIAHASRRAFEAVVGSVPPDSAFPGGTDAPWFSQAGIPTLPALGPGMLTSAHGPNEHVSLRSLEESARIYARILLEYCGTD